MLQSITWLSCRSRQRQTFARMMDIIPELIDTVEQLVTFVLNKFLFSIKNHQDLTNGK